jgi:fucose permease
LIGANDGALGVLIPGIRGHYRIDDTTIGLIFFSASLGYLLASFNNGLLVEKLGNRRFLILGTATYLLSAIVLSLEPSFVIILFTYLCLGVAVASLDAGLNAYVAGLPNNTTLLNYLHAFYGAGAWLGPFVASSLLALQWHWNHVYLIWAGLSLLVLVGFVSRFKVQATTLNVEVEESDKGNILLATARLRVVWIAAFFLLFYTGAEVSISNWGYSFLTDGQRVVPLFSGWMISGYWLGLTLGRVVLGHVGQRTGQVRLIQMSLVGVLAGIVLLWILPGIAASACGFFVIGFSLGPIFPTVIALMSRLVTPRILPGAVGFLASFANIGAALCSWSAGSVVQHIGPWSLLPLEVGFTGCMIMLWFMLHARRSNT